MIINNEILYVTVQSEKDNMGRQQFLFEWMDNNVGYFCNEVGIRVQCRV